MRTLKKPLSFEIKKASVDELQAEVVRSKIIEGVLSQVSPGEAAGFSFDLSFDLDFGSVMEGEKELGNRGLGGKVVLGQ